MKGNIMKEKLWENWNMKWKEDNCGKEACRKGKERKANKKWYCRKGMSMRGMKNEKEKVIKGKSNTKLN